MFHDREFIKELMTKHMEGRASPVEIEIILEALDFFDKEEITKMLSETDPVIDFGKYSKTRVETPPFRMLIDRIFKKGS